MKNLSLQTQASSLRAPSLINIVSWSQQLACEVLSPGDLAVDLTAGKGRDTYALAKAVGLEGQVVAFDLQAAAIEKTTEYLLANDLAVNHWSTDQTLPQKSGIFLIQACHSTLDKVLQRPAKVIMANLGYLPGGDQSLVTRPDSTLAALEQSLGLLAPGGRLVVTVYPAHPGGREEGDVVASLLALLPCDAWQVLRLTVVNSPEAPYLLVAELRLSLNR
jgi:predicted methyltransferase